MIFYFIYEILIKKYNFFNTLNNNIEYHNNIKYHNNKIEIIIDQTNEKNNYDLLDKYEINEIV